eukprot:GEMP01005106.1.p1 GENE.GEMP01005106.1~~GEMP01005106.1.p1  ORF type:complete len:362 (+),score=72.55 GEMP01005106.1:32-1117(+)
MLDAQYGHRVSYLRDTHFGPAHTMISADYGVGTSKSRPSYACDVMRNAVMADARKVKVINTHSIKEKLCGGRKALATIDNTDQMMSAPLAEQKTTKKRRREAAILTPRYSDPQMMTEYRADIVAYLTSCEKGFAPTTNYICNLHEITDNNRTVLIDWLIEIHYKYRMLPETLYLCCSMLDRYLYLRPETRRRSVQVFGTVCLLLASKFEEVDASPSIPDLVAVMGDAGTEEEVRDAECDVANTLKWNFVVATPYHFLLLFATDADIDHDSQLFFLAMFFLDCTLLDTQFLVLSPRKRSASSFYLACAKMKVEKNWVRLWEFPESDVRYWASALNNWFPRYRQMAVFRKFSRPAYQQAVQMA